MKPHKYRIWWSPLGSDGGSDTFLAIDKAEADAEAKRRMQEINSCGAYGSERINE